MLSIKDLCLEHQGSPDDVNHGNEGSPILKVLERRSETGERSKIHLLGLGDVGGIALIGLRLMGGKAFSEIGIYDLDEARMNRWEAEINQVYNEGLCSPPKVVRLTDEMLFDCDILAFCASRNVPEVGSGVTDVRRYQLDGNSTILAGVVEKALARNYKGLFAIISDPVDQLCMKALEFGKGQIAPDRIKGFGLGVMYARARYLALEAGYDPEQVEAFGPHGQGLVIANSMECGDYDDVVSQNLTRQTETFNMKMRSWGYKPFIAPALSSAALSLIAMAEGRSHHSTVYVEGVYLGVRNQLKGCKWVPKRYSMDPGLIKRLEATIEQLRLE